MPVGSITGSSGPSTPPADMISSQDALGKADFLQMLTAQLRAQDPMNPMDGQNFAEQLATFSSLQELQNMDRTMGQTLQANLLLAQSFNNTMASSLIGKTVRAEMDHFTLGQTGDATMTYNLPSAATNITVDIKDADGTVVKSIHVNPQAAGEHTLTWDGMDSNGKRAIPGNYTYTVTAKDPDGNPVQASTFLEGRVSAVQYVDGMAVLTINGETVQLGQVLSISDPDDGDAGKRVRI